MNQVTSTVSETTKVLRSHPGVRQAVAFRVALDNQAKVVSFVVANETYLDGALGRAATEQKQTRIWKKTYDLTQFAVAAAESPLAFNTLGWNSSYTRQPIPEDDMREWVETTVARIRSLGPRNVLEIGCGTGLLLLRIAPECAKYAGLDFSPAVLQRLREQLARMPELSSRVELFERSADDLQSFAENSFDGVVVNSVAQHFPNLFYLHRVLETAVALIRPGGFLFVGDQRSLPLLETYAVSVEAAGANTETHADELRQRVRRRVEQEQQLVLSPSFFLAAARGNSRVSSVGIFLRRGSRDNEMTRFRYDATLRIGPKAPLREIPFFTPPGAGWTLEGVRAKLAGNRAEALGFARIGNARVAADVGLRARLASADPQQPLREMLKGLQQRGADGVHPEALFALGHERGYEVALSWASCHGDGSYDAAFTRRSADEHFDSSAIHWPKPSAKDFVYYANAPGQAEIREKLAQALLADCRAQLPEVMVPGKLYLVDSLPTRSDGSVDGEALFAAAGEAAECST